MDGILGDLGHLHEDMEAGIVILKKFTAAKQGAYEEANVEFKDYGFDYHLQGAIYASSNLSVWVPKEDVMIVKSTIFDKEVWFAVEAQHPQVMEDYREMLKGMSRKQEELEQEETDIVSEFANLSGEGE